MIVYGKPASPYRGRYLRFHLPTVAEPELSTEAVLKKFTLLLDLGEIEITSDVFEDIEALRTSLTRNPFSVGERYDVSVWNTGGETFDGWTVFLKSQQAQIVGYEGLIAVKNFWHRLPKGRFYASVAPRESGREDRSVPCIGTCTDGSHLFRDHARSNVRFGNDALICFRRLK